MGGVEQILEAVEIDQDGAGVVRVGCIEDVCIWIWRKIRQRDVDVDSGACGRNNGFCCIGLVTNYWGEITWAGEGIVPRLKRYS